MSAEEERKLLDAAAALYASMGRFAARFARGKLRGDPVYAAMLRLGVLPASGRLVDLGCGRGLLLAVMAVARERFASGQWPAGWPAPPDRLALEGMERNASHADIARQALAGRARILRCDIRDGAIGSCTAVALLDVLLYLAPDAQHAILRQAAAALQAGGVLVVREADAGAGMSFGLTRGCERLLEALRGRPFGALYYRSAREWRALLESLDFSVEAMPMSDGTPFANVLFVCRKR